LNKPEWDIGKINQASKAAGPLAEWVSSQVKYATILDMVQPLRDEIAGLEAEGNELVKESERLTNLIDTLEKNID